MLAGSHLPDDLSEPRAVDLDYQVSGEYFPVVCGVGVFHNIQVGWWCLVFGFSE